MTKKHAYINEFILEYNHFYSLKLKKRFNQNLPEIKGSNFIWQTLLKIKSELIQSNQIFWICFINEKSQLKGTCELDESLYKKFDIHSLLAVVWLADVSRIVFVSTHFYSQEKKPFPFEIGLSNRFYKELKEFDVILEDHLILHNEDFYSMKDNELI